VAKKGQQSRSMHQQDLSAKLPRWSQVVIVAGLIILAGILLILKEQTRTADVSPSMGLPAPIEAPSTAPDQASWPTTVADGPTRLPTTPPPELPEAQFDRLLAESRPIFAFFHSNTCAKCVQMMGIVDQVHPEFAEQVALVDVNVYEEGNSNLLQRAQIRVIPTLIFIDRTGQGQVYTGVLPADALREQLRALAEE